MTSLILELLTPVLWGVAFVLCLALGYYILEYRLELLKTRGKLRTGFYEQSLALLDDDAVGDTVKQLIMMMSDDLDDSTIAADFLNKKDNDKPSDRALAFMRAYTQEIEALSPDKRRQVNKCLTYAIMAITYNSFWYGHLCRRYFVTRAIDNNPRKEITQVVSSAIPENGRHGRHYVAA